MSTRANIIIRDGYGKLYFYRHSDGYPECTFEDLKEFVNGYKSGVYRDNVEQSAGWLITYGAIGFQRYEFDQWKVGNYETATGIHSDIEYLYDINLKTRLLTCREVANAWDYKEDDLMAVEPIFRYYFGKSLDKVKQKV